MSLKKDLDTTIDFVSNIPYEISQIIFSNLSTTILLICRRVSKSWKQIAENDNIWRSKFQNQKNWKYYNDDSETDSWYELYKERYLLELNWKNDKFTKHKLAGHSDRTCCVKIFKNWIITGSLDSTIRIWDNETFKCLRVIGKIKKTRKIILSQTELSELIEKNDEIFHFDTVLYLDINDKYLISLSWDGSCIIWKLPDFKPIDRLELPSQGNYMLSNGVALYNDYIVCCGYDYIGVWKSSLDNLEHQLQFNFQLRIKGEGWVNGIYIHNGIIYGRVSGGIRSWNIETGQTIQEFRLYLTQFRINEQYLYANENYTLTVLDLQTNKTNLLPGEKTDRPLEFSIVNNKLITVHKDLNIKIWNLNDLKLYKEYTLDSGTLNLWPTSIVGDSKKLVAFTKDDDALVYDFTENLRQKYLKHL